MFTALLTRDSIAIDPPFKTRLAEAGLDSLPRVLACRGDHLAAWSRTTDAIRADLPDGGGGVFIKRYHYPTWRHRLRGALRGALFGVSRARAEYQTLAKMRRLGIHAIRPVAWAERRILGFVRSSALVTEAVPGAMSLARFVQSFAAREMTASRIRRKNEILRSLAGEIRRMHDAGFVHQDLFWRNVLIRPLSGDRFEFYFLDAAVGRRVRRWGRRRERIVHDLAALSVLAPDFCSRADQLRFMKQYLGTRRIKPEDRGWLLDVQKHWDRYRESERERLLKGRLFEPPDPRLLPASDSPTRAADRAAAGGVIS